MNSFPEWAQPWLARPNSQVSHGLNLVLELDPAPNRLPLMLRDIMLAQDKIKRVLEELSFVHFARFVPSWDGRALMVTTEFDGSLDPYVLDFVIALGDVFDTLLSYVKTPPPLPVREHPDEFLEWVRLWNRVPYYLRDVGGESVLLPEGFDYPLYSAYPDKTVTDIVGMRTSLPLPAPDHAAANVNPADVQGNILRGYGAKQVSYLLYSIADAAVARTWLAKTFPQPGMAWLGLTSAQDWGSATPEVLTQVGLTHEGLARLLRPSRLAELEHFPRAFLQGAAARADGNFDLGSSDPKDWLFSDRAEAVDVVLMLYTRTDLPATAYTAAVAALKSGAAEGLALLCEFAGQWDQHKAFGFEDGLSDPGISGQCPAAEPDYQPSASPGEFLLHEDYLSMYGGRSLGRMPQHLAGNGSFGVLRLMEPDEPLFKRTVATEATELGVKPERLTAKLMGRWPMGTPLTLAHDLPAEPSPAKASNAFDYAPSWEYPNEFNDHDGLRCPVGSHIRRANPRSARVAGQRHARRLLRRGMPVAWQDSDGSARTGLMGLFLGANIEQQFEFILREWLNGGLAASGIRGTSCPIVGNRSGTTDFPFLEADTDPNKPLVAKIPPLVRTRGCAYLFFPGLAALKALDDAVAPPVVVAPEEKIVTEGIAANNAAQDAAVDTAGQVVELVGGLLAQTGITIAGTAAVVTDSAAKLSRLLDVDAAMSAAGLDGLNQYLALLPPQLVSGVDWRDVIRDLVSRNLESPVVKEVLKSFSPPAIAIAPPPGTDPGGIELGKASFRANPFPALTALRAAGTRMVWVKEQQAYWVLGHADCVELLGRNNDFVQARSGAAFRGIVTLDDPRHAIVRPVFDAAFTVALTNTLPKIVLAIQTNVADLMAKPHLLQFDFMQAFAHPLARTVVWALIGIDDLEERKTFDSLADRMVLNFGHGNERGAVENMVFADAGLRLAGQLALALSKAWVNSFRLDLPSPGSLIGELAARMSPVPGWPGRPLDFMETLMTLVQTVLASQSPHFLLGSAALHLLKPNAGGVTPWSLLAASVGTPAFEPALVLALEEARRFEPPLSLIDRYAQGEQKICGVTVPDGCQVSAMIASANRDKVFRNLPEQFNAGRLNAGQHVSLGQGSHECAGRALQAALVSGALSAAIQAWPQLRLSRPSAVPAWQPTIHFRLLQALSVARCPPP